MKTTTISVKTIMVILLGFLLIGCSAKDGMDGATGPQGPQGEQGEQGEDGNANVIASSWIPEEFVDIAVSASNFTVTDEAFTSEILNSGTVLVYGRDGEFVVPIPVVLNNQTYFFVLPETLGEILFVARTVDDTADFFDLFTDFRYVIIPASNTSAREGERNDFNKMTYYEVMDHFDLAY
ncbi:collagen-like protein [Ulvibacterium marinum]|nr:collagen-like protein [Ulvibacterium marinum]